jgi:ubiquinone/menaquinone biosynthesis C-methylase UbiE
VSAPFEQEPHVPGSRFGRWFLGSKIWAKYVLTPAIDDFERLLHKRRIAAPLVVDVGCGFGRSIKLLHECFAPRQLIGIDIDAQLLQISAADAKRDGIAAEFRQAGCKHLPLASQSADIVLCHQTFHHLVDQARALREFHRVLKPGGLLLFAESTRKYIHSRIIRLLFRHPMDMQKSAEQYLEMLRGAGFDIAPDEVSYPYLWWSRPDLGILQRWFGVAPSAKHEETLINAVAVRR